MQLISMESSLGQFTALIYRIWKFTEALILKCKDGQAGILFLIIIPDNKIKVTVFSEVRYRSSN